MASSAPAPRPAPGWHRYAPELLAADTAARAVVYGDDLPTEAELKLLGTVEGKRILDLGCGTGQNAVVLASAGAKVIGVDPSTDALAAARQRAEAADVRVELHQAGLAELAFLRSDSVDAAISVMGLATTDDIARVFRQVHRVLKPEAPLICSLPHPAWAMFDPAAEDPLRAVRAYDDASERPWSTEAADVVDRPRTFSDLFTTFQRSNFRVDQVIEPTAGADASAELARYVPATLVLRARKQGN